MASEIGRYDREVLEMLAGKREPIWGAWVGACLEWLAGHGYATKGPNFQITSAGLEALREVESR